MRDDSGREDGSEARTGAAGRRKSGARRPGGMMDVRVVAIIPTYRRADLLARALGSLSDECPELARVIVVNNSSDPATAAVAASAAVSTTIIDLGCNLGMAGGIAAGMDEMLRDPDATHVWILDDDNVVQPGALRAMLRACEIGRADASAPLAVDEHGRVRWFPGPLSGPAWSAIRAAPMAEDFAAQVGDAPLAWNWAYWAGLLVSRRGIETVGGPNLDLWFAFTDLEYALRLSARFRCVLAPAAVIQHLQPSVPAESTRSARIYWALQNGDYVAVRLRHGWRALRHLPGHQIRYLRHYRWRPRAWWDVAQALVLGALLGRVEGRTARRSEAREAARVLAALRAGQVPAK